MFGSALAGGQSFESMSVFSAFICTSMLSQVMGYAWRMPSATGVLLGIAVSLSDWLPCRRCRESAQRCLRLLFLSLSLRGIPNNFMAPSLAPAFAVAPVRCLRLQILSLAPRATSVLVRLY